MDKILITILVVGMSLTSMIGTIVYFQREANIQEQKDRNYFVTHCERSEGLAFLFENRDGTLSLKCMKPNQ